MKKIAIIINEIHPLIEVIQKNLLLRNHECDFIFWNEVVWEYCPKMKIKSNLDQYNAIYLDRLGEATYSYVIQIIMYCSIGEKIPIINPPENYLIARDKALMSIYFEKYNFIFPKTFVIHNKEGIKKALEYSFDYFVIKSTQGFSSNEVEIVHRKVIPYSKFLKKILKRDKIVIIQEYIENPKDFIWRVDIVDGKVIVANKRFRYNKVGKPICNGTQGGKIIFYNADEIDSEIRDFSIKVCEKMHLSVAGLDIVVSSNNIPYLIEVNPEPDITLNRYEFPEAIADFLVKKAK